MGTVNYSRSDYITMGVKPYDPADFTFCGGCNSSFRSVRGYVKGVKHEIQ